MISNGVIFLDIDGVLNDHGPVLNYYCGINKENVEVFNILYKALGEPDIVISSAWRYIMLNGAMTLQGFGYMMITHGFYGNIVGFTVPDETIRGRNYQVQDYLVRHNYDSYLIIDDLDLGFSRTCPTHFYQTNGDKGLVQSDINKIINMKGLGI